MNTGVDILGGINKQDFVLSALTAFYDLEYGPVSFDFCTWLVRAMVEQRERKCDKLHVVIVPKEDGLGGFSRNWGNHDEHATYWRLWHIVVSTCQLANASVTVAHSRHQAMVMPCRDPGQSKDEEGNVWWPEGKAHFMGPLVEAARSGKEVPRLKATMQARRYVGAWLANRGRPIATLTTRQQTTDPARNSNLREWDRLHEWFQSKDYEVIRVQESNDALSMGRGYVELDPDLRLALYERAAINVIGNNGPQELLKFSEAPYVIVGLALSDGWKDHFRKYFSMEPGEQLPWASKKQRMVYEPDSFDVMRRACEEVINETRST